jgi:hypothetical protein
MILLMLPSLLWYFLKQLYSPWWLENFFSTPVIILMIYCILMIFVIYYLPIKLGLTCLLVNLFLVCLFNNESNYNNSKYLNQTMCAEPVKIFQFNMKYTENMDDIERLTAFLFGSRYHLITLQGVSQQVKAKLIERLNPYYPYFINGENHQKQVFSDQLIFSSFGFANITYGKNFQSAYLISSQWLLADKIIDLHTLHPPSPRSEVLWKARNKVLYQLKTKVNKPAENLVMIIGDLNISKHSKRVSVFTKDMNTLFVNSWPNKPYFPAFFALAIDHLWLSKSATICMRRRIDEFNWSDHYAIESEIFFHDR